jgi:biotin carboxyl carrier protein
MKIREGEGNPMKINVEINGEKFSVEVENIHTRPVIAVIDGERFEVWPESEPQDTQVATTPSVPLVSVPESSSPSVDMVQQARTKTSTTITAPLPGVIIAIAVKPGDQVTHGQELCTLEAMKMKNAIRANREGVIATVEINVGDQVGHGQIIMTFES